MPAPLPCMAQRWRMTPRCRACSVVLLVSMCAGSNPSCFGLLAEVGRQ